MSLNLVNTHLRYPLKGFLQSKLVKQCTVCCCRYLQSNVNLGYNNDKPIERKVVVPSLHVFKTDESNPNNHSMRHEGLLYTINKDDFLRLSYDKTYRRFRKQFYTFQEACIMVRKPALEVIHLLKNLDLTLPIPKVVLYGKPGSGKSLTLLHVLHYASINNWFIIRTPWPQLWTQWYTEIQNSSFKPGRIDMPVEAKDFLEQLLLQNGSILEKYQTQFRYQWTKRESSEIGTSLKELVEFGMARVKFADDVVGAIFKEVKQLAKDQKIKVLLAVDGINGFYRATRMKTTKKAFKDTQQAKEKAVYLPVDDVSLVQNLKMFLEPDMVNAVCVSTVDSNILLAEERKNIETPNFLLGDEGFRALDPFIPIHVPEYSDKEALSMLDYYVERNWIIKPKGRTDEGKKQLMFLSNKNPYELMMVCETV